MLRRVRDTPRAIVVFDVDSTLLSTAARHHGILVDFARHLQDHDVSAIIADLAPSDFGWTVDGPLAGRVAPERLAGLGDFWRERFFSGAYLHLDRPVPGAVEFVTQAHRAGAFVVYLTARHLPEMGPGTTESLLRWGFPFALERTQLVMKPSRSLGDGAFKRSALDALAAWGSVVATFENDPANANAFVERFPQAVHVLLDTVCAADAPTPDPRLVRIPDFTRRSP